MAFKKQQVTVCFLVYLLFYSCSPKPKNEPLLKELNSSFEQYFLFLQAENINTIEAFKQKLADPATKVKAGLYYPKILKVQQATDTVTTFIDSLKGLLQTETSLNENEKDGKRKTSFELLVNSGTYKEIYKRLKKYREEVLNPDSMRLSEIKNNTFIINREQDTLDNDDFLKQRFADASSIEAISYLNRLKNNLATAELKCIKYYNGNVYAHIDGFKAYQAIVAQNAKVLKIGDYLEISGGVGAFSIERLLQFSIDGKAIQPDERGIGVYKFKTSKKPGHNSLPVDIRLLDEDSTEQRLRFTVEYELVNTIKK